MDNTTPAVRKRRTPEERREEIIRAAITLFARQGFERTTTKEIAAAAGISEGTIYKYFTSKQEILFAFIEPVAFKTVPEFFAEHRDHDDEQLVCAFIRNRFSIFENNRDLVRVIFGEAMFNPSLAGELHRMIAPAKGALVEYINRREQEGIFREVDPEVAARALMGSILMTFVVWDLLVQGQPSVTSNVTLSEELTGIFLRGVLKTTGAADVTAKSKESR